MPGPEAQASGALLVGSVPLDTVEDVFEVVAGNLGGHLTSIPDGEVGERDTWLVFQANSFDASPQIEEVEPTAVPPEPTGPGRQFAPVAGAGPDDIEFGALGYRDAALSSYESFKRLKSEGKIPEHVRFQVSLPTPLAPVFVFFGATPAAATVEPAYERALLAELDAIVDAIPHDQLAIQWDVCMEILFLLGVPGWWTGDAWEGCRERWARYASHVPDDVLLGYHLCYGDYNHKHFAEPTDTKLLTEMSNALVEVAGRSVDWIHLPVPREQKEDAYFEALSGLRIGDAKLYLGLVHLTDGEQGARERIAAAARHIQGFGVATECGFGRRPVEQVAPLLAIHAAVSDPV